MLSVSTDVFKYNLSPYLGPKDVLHLSETCTQLLSYYPTEARQEISYKLRLEHAKRTFSEYSSLSLSVKQYDWANTCYNAIENNAQHRIYVKPMEGCSTLIWVFALHVLFNGLFENVVIVVNYRNSHHTMLNWLNMLSVEHYNVVVQQSSIMYTTFINSRTGATYTIYVCTNKDYHNDMVSKRRKIKIHTNTLVLSDNSIDDDIPGRIKIKFECLF